MDYIEMRNKIVRKMYVFERALIGLALPERRSESTIAVYREYRFLASEAWGLCNLK